MDLGDVHAGGAQARLPVRAGGGELGGAKLGDRVAFVERELVARLGAREDLDGLLDEVARAVERAQHDGGGAVDGRGGVEHAQRLGDHGLLRTDSRVIALGNATFGLRAPFSWFFTLTSASSSRVVP